MAVIAVIMLFGCVLVALVPGRAPDGTDRLVARMRIELSGLEIEPPGRLLQNDMLYVTAPSRERGADRRPVARIRPASGQRVRVAMYDDGRHGYGREELLDMPEAVSRIGLAAASL